MSGSDSAVNHVIARRAVRARGFAGSIASYSSGGKRPGICRLSFVPSSMARQCGPSA